MEPRFLRLVGHGRKLGPCHLPQVSAYKAFIWILIHLKLSTL